MPENHPLICCLPPVLRYTVLYPPFALLQFPALWEGPDSDSTEPVPRGESLQNRDLQKEDWSNSNREKVNENRINNSVRDVFFSSWGEKGWCCLKVLHSNMDFCHIMPKVSHMWVTRNQYSCSVRSSALFLTKLLILVGVSSKTCPKETVLVEDSCIFTVYSKRVVKWFTVLYNLENHNSYLWKKWQCWDNETVKDSQNRITERQQ